MKRLIGSGLVWLGCSFTSIAFAGSITFNTAMPVAENNIVLREQVFVMRSGDDASNMERDMKVDGLISVLGYGATEKLAVFGVLPYISKRLDTLNDGTKEKRSNSGLGDLTLFSRYTLYQKDRSSETFRIAGFAGLEVPTADDDKSDNLGKLPPSMQLGSGSWDGFIGIVSTWQTLDYQLDGQIAYRSNSEANDFESGDELYIDGSLQYRLWPSELSDGVPSFVYGVLEINIVEKDKNRVANVIDNNSGGTTIFLSPGIQYVRVLGQSEFLDSDLEWLIFITQANERVG